MAGPADSMKSQTFLRNMLGGKTGEPPPPEVLTWLHALAPYRQVNDLHHRIGQNAYDAAAGNHRHTGEDNSVPLFDDLDVIEGDLSTTAGLQTAVRKIAQLLAELGATNSTTN